MLPCLLCSAPAQADWWKFWQSSSAQDVQGVQVAEPFIELRSGPSELYPVIHSTEAGEWLLILRRKTEWIKVQDEKQRVGWVHIDEIVKTKAPNGEPVAITAPRFDDFRTRRWEGGLLMGEYDSTAVNAAYLGYWMTANLSAELSAAQVLGNEGERRMFGLNLLHQPFPAWRVSPFFTLGGGQMMIEPKAQLVQPENSDEPYANAGIGLRWYINDRYFVRAEVRDYKVFTKDEFNEEATEWKLGLSVFF